MKQRLADYVADFLAARGVTDVFSVVGGGAMHLNDASSLAKKSRGPRFCSAITGTPYFHLVLSIPQGRGVPQCPIY